MSPRGEIQPVILSGGSGTRLWPLSTEERPKQLLALTAKRTMLQLTVDRVPTDDFFAPPLIVANEPHTEEIQRQLNEIGVEDSHLILEPVGRNTAAAIALAALRSEPAGLLLVMPSDHVIGDADAFRASVRSALQVAEQGYLVTFGIEPDAPVTGYGYIKAGEILAPSIFHVNRFVEKPGPIEATEYVESGHYSWNAGIFLFRAGDYLEALERYSPEILAACKAAVAKGREEANLFYPEAAAFARSPSISVDYAVLEKAERVAVVPIDVSWSDIGSWDALYDYMQGVTDPDTDGIQIDSHGCLVRSDGPLVAAVGVQDLIIIATGGAVLVMPRGQSQRVKEVVDRMNARREAPGG